MRIRKSIISAGLLIACVFAVLASNAQMQSSTKLATTSTEKKSAWSMPVTIEGASSVHSENDYDKHSEMNVLFEPSYKLNDSWTLAGKFGGYRNVTDSTDAQDADFANTVIGLSHKTQVNDNTTWTKSVSGTLPTSEFAREETSYRGTVKVATGLAWENLFWGSSIKDSISYGRNIHEFTQSAAGGFNLRDVVANTFAWNLPLPADFSLSTSFLYQGAWDYAGSTKFKFSTSVGLGYDVSKELSAYVSLGNEGDALRPNGKDTNIAVFDDTSSMVRAGLTYVF